MQCKVASQGIGDWSSRQGRGSGGGASREDGPSPVEKKYSAQILIANGGVFGIVFTGISNCNERVGGSLESVMQRIAVITGASGAIGKAVAERFKHDNYLVCGIDMIEIENEHLDFFIKCDLNAMVNSSDILDDVLLKIKHWAGTQTIDVLVNNAAYQHVSRAHPIPVSELMKSYSTNVIAPYLLITTLLESMTRETGSVVNVGSIHSRLTKPGFIAYATTKAALAAMTRGLALDLEDRIRINCIEPASVETPMLVDGFKGFPEKMRELESYHPQKRIAKAVEIAELIFVISSSKVRFLHGSCIDMSGGISCQLHDPA